MPGPVPSEPLLCKFADGGQKKRQSQGKYLMNGRTWTRDGETVSLFPSWMTPGILLLMLCCFSVRYIDHSRKRLIFCILRPGRNDPFVRSHHSLTERVSKSSLKKPHAGSIQRQQDDVGVTNCFCVCRFYSSPYSITPNRMMGPTSLSPYIHSPVSAYQVRTTLTAVVGLNYSVKSIPKFIVI